MTEHHGWDIPAFFSSPDDEAARVRESAGLADISWMVEFDLKGQGLRTPPAIGPEARWWELARLHGLLTCEPSARSAVSDTLHKMQSTQADPFAPLPFYVTDVSPVYTHLLLAGPRSREVLSKLTSLNLSESSLKDLSCAQASVAHVHAIVLRQDLKIVPAYHLLVGRDYGESVWESVLHAGHEFHIVPFGLKSQQLLQG